MEYTDYELYQLLEANGYKTTEKNLKILTEGLESGKYELVDESVDDTDYDEEEITIQEMAFSDYDFYTILDLAGYETTNENLAILKEGYEDGTYIISDEGEILTEDYTSRMMNQLNTADTDAAIKKAKIKHKFTKKSADIKRQEDNAGNHGGLFARLAQRRQHRRQMKTTINGSAENMENDITDANKTRVANSVVTAKGSGKNGSRKGGTYYGSLKDVSAANTMGTSTPGTYRERTFTIKRH